jgi:serine/threonine-protein phosphatase 2B catalytic subunit
MEALSDPCHDRPIKTLTPPPHKSLSHEKLFPSHLKRGTAEVPDWKLLK